MLSALEQFHDNIVRVRGLGGIHQAVASMTTSAIDTSDILRAEYVLAASALDHYVHEVTRLGMLETFDGLRQPSAAYLRFRISISYLAGNQTVSRSDIETEIRAQHSYVVFQRPDRIADGIRLISEVKLWDAVGTRIGVAPDWIKQRLSLIVDRRNKIAHEADLDPTYPKARWPISRVDVDDVVDFLVQIVEAIHLEVQ
jgi:hypothetical protein